MMFGRKMKTKLPQNQKRKKGSDREEEARAKHNHKKSQQKEAFDKRRRGPHTAEEDISQFTLGPGRV